MTGAVLQMSRKTDETKKQSWKEEQCQPYRNRLRYHWQANKPKGEIKQIAEVRHIQSFPRKPFFGDSCEKMTVLLDNGRIACHYFNEEYSLWQVYLFV